MQRYDTVSIQAVKTDEGFIRDTPIIGRTGIMKYINADGKERIEYRPPEEAFNADSLASIEGKPITIGHKAMVTAKNAKTVAPVGTVLTGGRQDGDNIRADVVIYNLDTNARELSCGYTLDLDETAGVTPDGQHYDAIQRNIRYNHLALVDKGRAGIARLNMDGSQVIDEERKDDKTMKDKMTKIRLDSGLEYDAAQEVGVYVEKLRQDMAEAQKEKDQLQAKYDTAISDMEKEKKAHEDAQAEAKKNFDESVKARVSMLAIAKDHNVDKAEEMTDSEIKIAVIKAVRGDNFSLEGKSEDYINAAYDIARMDKAETGIAKQREEMNKKKSNADEDEALTVGQALAKLRKDEAEAYLKEVK